MIKNKSVIRPSILNVSHEKSKHWKHQSLNKSGEIEMPKKKKQFNIYQSAKNFDDENADPNIFQADIPTFGNEIL